MNSAYIYLHTYLGENVKTIDHVLREDQPPCERVQPLEAKIHLHPHRRRIPGHNCHIMITISRGMKTPQDFIKKKKSLGVTELCSTSN